MAVSVGGQSASLAQHKVGFCVGCKALDRNELNINNICKLASVFHVGVLGKSPFVQLGGKVGGAHLAKWQIL